MISVTNVSSLFSCRYIDEEDEDAEPIRQKRVEKNALKSQLRTMQEQLAEMQQKYVQLCTRMESAQGSPEVVEEIPSDSEQSKRSPPSSPVRSVSTPNPPPVAVSLAQQVSRITPSQVEVA